MKIWVDDVRPAPDKTYYHARSVKMAKEAIVNSEKFSQRYEACMGRRIKNNPYRIELIDLDHDAGDYAFDGGDYIRLLDWLEETERNYPIRIHSANPVGIANMRRIIKRNGWEEVL